MVCNIQCRIFETQCIQLPQFYSRQLG